jgi:hypothetical protein
MLKKDHPEELKPGGVPMGPCMKIFKEWDGV